MTGAGVIASQLTQEKQTAIGAGGIINMGEILLCYNHRLTTRGGGVTVISFVTVFT